MSEIAISALKDSLLQDGTVIEFSSECYCMFDWNYDSDLRVLSCEISERGCTQTKTLKSRGYKIMRNTLPTFGKSRDGYFVIGIGREDIPDPLFRQVHMESLDQVRGKHAIQHEVRLRESLLDWVRSSGVFVDVADDRPVIRVSKQPAEILDVRLALWIIAVLPILQEENSDQNRLLYLDFSQFDE